MLHPNDYRVITRRFEEMFGVYRSRQRLDFGGPNFMTPDVLGVLAVGGLVEVSYGTGFDRQPIFGLTWQRHADGAHDLRDRLCHSLDEVRTYLMSIDGFAEHSLP